MLSCSKSQSALTNSHHVTHVDSDRTLACISACTGLQPLNSMNTTKVGRWVLTHELQSSTSQRWRWKEPTSYYYTMQTVKFSILAEVTYIGDGDKELYIASRSNTQKVTKQTRFYTTQLGKKERKTQKQHCKKMFLLKWQKSTAAVMNPSWQNTFWWN